MRRIASKITKLAPKYLHSICVFCVISEIEIAIFLNTKVGGQIKKLWESIMHNMNFLRYFGGEKHEQLNITTK